MKLRNGTGLIFLLSLWVIFSSLVLTREAGAQAGRVGTQTCIACHRGWPDNDPPIEDEIFLPVDPDYVPLNLLSTHAENPFYTIPQGYVSSSHYTPPFNLLARDEVTCEGCHGSGLAHYGVGFIPRAIPQSDTCALCHQPPFFDISAYFATSHANQNGNPGKYFDQGWNGTGQAQTSSYPNVGQVVSLFQSDRQTPVSKNERIEECSTCHSYALQYPQFQKKILQNNMPDPQVSCGACHDSHIPGPNGNQQFAVNGPVRITSVLTSASGATTVAAVTPFEKMASYLNHKPYKIAEEAILEDLPGAQDPINGIWTRGSAITRPNLAIVKGVGTLSVASDGSNLLTFGGGGFQGNVKELNTVLLSGTASATANLPADAANTGPVTVKATFDRFGLEVLEAIDDNTLLLGAAPTTTATVTYLKKAGGLGTLSVPITFTGPINFDVSDMYTNTETLCGTCHTQGNLKFSAFGQKADGAFVDVSKTHNVDVIGQYLFSGHGNKRAIPFEEFTAFGGHKILYPHDQSITGTGGVGSLRNRSNTSYELTQTPSPANVFLSFTLNTTLPLVTSTSFDCNQCHHGLGAIDFIKSVQKTSDASVLWGDATVTCLTCHDPHANPGKNVRIPTNLSIGSQFVSTNNPNGTMNKFLDGTDIQPEVGNGAICLFCHQGRESGLTVYLRFKAKNIDPYANPDAVLGNTTFPNPHYLDSGSLVWSRNMWEFFFNNVPQTYSTGVKAHQDLNCMGCHMGEANAAGTEGGHTWRPRLETCQGCHKKADGTPLQSFTDVPASADYDGDGVVKTTFEEIGIVSEEGKSGTGLFGQVVAALQAKGIFYNPDTRPYFFDAAGVGWNKFTSKTLGAAFNLGLAWKSGNCVPYHNAPYIVQIFQDGLKALDVAPKGVRPPPPATGSRPATDYRVTENNIPK